MENIDTIKNQMTDAIKKSNFQQCFSILDTYLIKEGSTKGNQFNAIVSQYSRNRNDHLLSIVNIEDYKVTLNKLTILIIEFINDLEFKDFSPEKIRAAGIYEKILVLSPNEQEENKIKSYFDQFYYRKVTHDCSGILKDQDILDQQDFLIFNNMQESQDIEFYTLLKSYLEQRTCMILYYGSEQKKIVSKYPERVYSANSVFALHSRVREMIEFRKYMNLNS